MPTRLPVVQELERHGIRSSESVIGYKPGIKEAAQAELGNTVASVGSKVSRMALYYTDEMNKKEAKEALLSLQEQMLQEEVNMNKVKGSAAFHPDFLPTQLQTFDMIKDGVATNLSDGAKVHLEEAIRKERMNYEKKVVIHSLTEEENMGKYLFDKSGQIAIQTAAQNYGEVGVVDEQRQILADNTEEYLTSKGITDPKLIEAEYLKRVSAMHAGVVSAMVEDQYYEGAKKYLDKYVELGELTAADKEKAHEEIEPQENYSVGLALAGEAYKMVDEGADPVEGLNHILKTAKNSQQLSAASAIYDKTMAARVAGYQKTAAEILGNQLDGSADYRHDRRMVELKKKAPGVHAKLLGAINTLENGKDRQTDPQTTLPQTIAGATLEADPNLTEQAIYQDADKLGAREVKRLIGVVTKRKVAKANKDTAAIDSFHIDPDLVNIGMPKSANTDQKKALKGIVERNLRRWTTANQRTPNVEEQLDIIGSVTEKWVERGSGKGGDPLWGEPDQEEYWKIEEGERMYPVSFGDLHDKTLPPSYIKRIWDQIEEWRRAIPDEVLDDVRGIQMWYEMIELEGKKQSTPEDQARRAAEIERLRQGK